MEGTVTGEHGVGLIKRDYLAHETSESTVDAMRKVSYALNGSLCRDADSSLQLKQAFDPLCILNCDKIVRVEKPASGEVKAW